MNSASADEEKLKKIFLFLMFKSLFKLSTVRLTVLKLNFSHLPESKSALNGTPSSESSAFETSEKRKKSIFVQISYSLHEDPENDAQKKSNTKITNTILL
jgi:hypothetical protein